LRVSALAALVSSLGMSLAATSVDGRGQANGVLVASRVSVLAALVSLLGMSLAAVSADGRGQANGALLASRVLALAALLVSLGMMLAATSVASRWRRRRREPAPTPAKRYESYAAHGQA
jgi:hypothetical protein